ncbi:beta-lactamase [Patella vulgata]|uniref:beta-lactamase n=1 Tax=Patella vulgata TaxID=6465 RepID=UPI0024A97319|nr:beta-lactamase [Patella vulgata]
MNKLGLVFYIAAIAQTTDAAANKISESDLKAFVGHVLKCYNISGLSLAMVTKSQTIFTGGFGVKTFEKGDLVTSKTLFNVGSVSKSFTATIAADAVSRGKIEWDKPLKDTFGKDFQLSDSFRTERASLRDVLAHKMCVPEYWGATTIAENITRQEMIKRLPFYTTFCDLRTEYQYSNQMVVAGAAAVEIATCQYWEDAIFQKIYKPLGMNGSRIGSRMSDGDWANTAISYTNFNGKPVPNPEQQQSIILDYMGPAAGVYSNAEDMAKYLRFHLNNGKDENGKQVIAEKELGDTHRSNYAIQQTDQVTTNIFPVMSTIDAYGMGWRTGYYRGYRKVEHTGSFSGYTCRNTFLPDVDVGVWLCEASSYDGYTANQLVSWYTLDMLLGEQPWLKPIDYPAGH